METTATPDRLEFRGGMYVAFVAPVIFLAGVIAYFIAFNVFDMNALTASGLVGLLIGALLARKYSSYWDAALRGVSSPTASTLLMILLAVSLFSMLLSTSGAANGLIWAAQEAGVSPSLFPAIAFAIAGVMSMSTGTSIGTLFTAFPVIFPAGTALGAHPLLLAGASCPARCSATTSRRSPTPRSCRRRPSGSAARRAWPTSPVWSAPAPATR
jgi:Na+/H+ antiporter NhaC